MIEQKNISRGPHQGQPVRIAGDLVDCARAAMLMIHGRGARAEDILSLADQFAQPRFAYLAPQAAENSWYPNRFLAPVESNEPWLTSALTFVNDVYSQIVYAGIPPERIMLLGFSQGACLALEFATRNARRYGGVVGLSGALIGPGDMRREQSGSLAGTPVFLGCSEVDIHVSKERVNQTGEVMRGLGGEVAMRLYPNLDHSINQDEIDYVRSMMQALIAGS